MFVNSALTYVHTRKHFYIRFFIFILFVSVNIHLVFQHEVWRDETQGWLIAINSDSLDQLFESKRYEIQPPGWYLLLFLVSRISKNIVALRLMQISLVAILYLILIYWVRFRIPYIFLCLSSFYILFGSTILARDYILIAIFLAMWAGLINRGYPYTKSHYFLLCGFVSSVNIFGILLALAFLFSFLSNLFYERRKNTLSKGLTLLNGIMVTLLLIWVLIMITLAKPPADHLFVSEHKDNSPLFGSVETRPNYIFWKLIGFFAQLFFPWSKNYTVTHTSLIFALASIICLSISLKFLSNTFVKHFCISSLFLFLFFHLFFYSPFWWHRSTISILILLSFLLELSGNTSSQISHYRFLAYSFVFVQCAGSFFGIGTTFFSSYPYSNAEAAGNYVKSICDDSCTLIADTDMASSAILAVFPNKQIFYLNRREFGTFAVWRKLDNDSSTNQELLDNLLDEYSNSIVILSTNSPLRVGEDFSVARFENSLTGDDYLIFHKGL